MMAHRPRSAVMRRLSVRISINENGQGRREKSDEEEDRDSFAR